MDFSSLPVNQFDSHNWQQQGNQQQLDRVTTDQNPNFNLPQLPSPPANSQAGSSQPRVNSMVERARIAKVPLPEAALKCPRCDSNNTKFCYFNNYNLTQPRHFCKTCRRYWTRGGALRNVPVGGGFRRNKRSKSNGGRSKSTVVVSADNNTTTTTTTSLTSHPSYSNPSKFLGYGQIPGFTSNLTTMSPLQSLGDYNSSNIGLDFGGIQISNAMSGMSSNSGILDPWRITSLQQAQQFPFLMNNNTGLEQSSSALYPLLQGNEGVNQANTQQESSNYSNHLRSKPLMDMASSRNAAQPINVKAEEKDQDQDRDGNGVNNLSRNLLENINMNSAGNNEYTTWGGSGNLNSSWTGFTTSNNSTGHLSF